MEEVRQQLIVDTHHHLWDLSMFRLPWLDGAGALNRDHLMDEYLRETKGLGVVETVYMEVAVEPSQRVAEAEYVIDQCRREDNPMVAAVIGGSPGSPEFRDYLSRFADNPCIKGIRGAFQVEVTDHVSHFTPQFIKDIQLLGECGLSFDVCVGSDQLPDAVCLVDACPRTRFILDHCGNANVQSGDLSQWRRDIAELASRRNIICKVSGIVASAKPGKWKPGDLAPIVNNVIAEFGWDRVVFGGDWPVCTRTASFRKWAEALQWIVRDASEVDRRKLFHDNAVRFYGL